MAVAISSARTKDDSSASRIVHTVGARLTAGITWYAKDEDVF